MTPAITYQLFAKAPVAGAVKTRLYPALGAQDAATLHTRLVAHAAGAVAAACAAFAGARGELWCSPDPTNEVLRAIADRHGLALRQQAAGNLGERMQFALQSAMPGHAILLGSDCPLLDPDSLLRAHHALTSHDVVIVPVEDGGYALIGCRGQVPDCFADMAWSTGDVMPCTRDRLAATGVRWVELPVAWDVDTPADLARLRTDLRFSHLAAGFDGALHR